MLEHFVTNTGKLWKKMLRKNVGKLLKNVDEKKCWQHFRKMWATLLKMLTKKCRQHLKNVVEKMFATFSEKC
jgi:hypothetical protein